MKNLDHDRGIETHVDRVVDACHAALTHAMHDGVTTASNLTECRYGRIGRSLTLVGVFGHADAAPYAARCLGPVPASAIRAEHRSGSELHAHEVVRRPGTSDVEVQGGLPL